MKLRRQTGFSLLEAVVAMVLISGAGYALFGWINANIMTLNSIRESNARAEATRNILEYMTDINPMSKPLGEASLGTYSFRWESKPATAIQEGISLYQLGLFETLIKIERGRGEQWFEFKLRQVGYKRVRENTPP